MAKGLDGTEKTSSTVTKAVSITILSRNVFSTSSDFKCAIHESNLSEVISVQMDLNGHFLSIAVAGTNPSCVSDPAIDQRRTTFNSTVVIGHQVVGPV